MRRWRCGGGLCHLCGLHSVKIVELFILIHRLSLLNSYYVFFQRVHLACHRRNSIDVTTVITLTIALFFEVPSKPWPVWQWVSVHNIRTPKLRQPNGIQVSFVLHPHQNVSHQKISYNLFTIKLKCIIPYRRTLLDQQINNSSKITFKFSLSVFASRGETKKKIS